MRWLVLLAILLVTIPACERRVEEPAGGGRGSGSARDKLSQAAPPAPADSSPAVSAQAPPPPPPRCVAETPERPARPAPPRGPDPSCPDDPEGRPALARAKVVFDAADVSLDVEVAKEDAHRMRGLMYRTELLEEEGMLFVFEQRRVHRFWMKNTCIPLDMLFIDADGLIVGIEENVPTMNTNTYHVRCPSLYVLEVNAGWCRRHGVKAGQTAKLVGV